MNENVKNKLHPANPAPFEIQCWPKILSALFALACLCYLAFCITSMFEINTLRHDALINLDSYDRKLEREGRWINHLLFDFLKTEFSPYLAGLIQITALFWFSITVAHQVSGKLSLSICFACLTALIPINANMLFWPLTAAPAFICLILAAKFKNLPFWAFFPIFGVLFFGTMSNYYFLLPLLFLNDKRIIDKPRQLVNFVGLWVSGYVLGYIASNVRVYFYFGKLIELDDWRNPRPIESLDTLLFNFHGLLRNVYTDLNMVVDGLGVIITISILAFGIYSFKKTKATDIILCLLVMLSVYASVFPYGLWIFPRTTITLWSSIFCILLLRRNLSSKDNLLCVALVSLATFNLGQCFREHLDYVNKPLAFHKAELMKITSEIPFQFDSILLIGEDRDFKLANEFVRKCHGMTPEKRYIEDVSESSRISPALKSMGYTTTTNCKSESIPQDLCLIAENTNDDKSIYNLSTTADRWIAIRLNQEIDRILSPNMCGVQ